MLTSEQSIVEYRAGRVVPDRLTQNTHRHYLEYAERMLAVYREGIGRRRRELHRQVEAIFADEPDCPIRRIEAFCKLLDDASIFQADPSGKAAKLRLDVFSKAARLHPLVQAPDRLFEHEEGAAKSQLAEELGTPWEAIEQGLYADVMAYQQLEEFTGYPDAAAFLSRYNVAQLQACLYRAESMTVTATRDLKTIIRYAKLAKLLHEITRGTASLVSRAHGYSRHPRARCPCYSWAGCPCSYVSDHLHRPGVGPARDAALRRELRAVPARAAGLQRLEDGGGRADALENPGEARHLRGGPLHQPPAAAGGIRLRLWSSRWPTSSARHATGGN